MSSKKTEDVHTQLLKKLLSDSGLVCLRSVPESLESSTESGEGEEGLEEEAEEAPPEIIPEEEVKSESAATPEEEQPTVFPTPSLRKVLPDKVRKLEPYNRIHVLPDEFRTDIDPMAIPKIAVTAQVKYIDTLAEMVGCNKYQSSLAEFWFLDTLANLLRRAQEDDLNRPTQAILILWFCQWMKEMQYFDAADRQRMLRRFQENMLAAARIVGDENRIPTPIEAGILYKAPEDSKAPRLSIATQAVEEPPVAVTFEGVAFECSLQDLSKIIHYIYDLFSTEYQYNLVRSVFTFTPDYELIDAPYQIQTPKRIYVPLKVKPKKEKPAKPKAAAVDKNKAKKKEPDTEEYLGLMALKAKDDQDREEQEEKDREEWNRRSKILPLTFAATEEFFNKYWPPPPPPPPPPEPEVDAAQRGSPKKKGKK